MTEFEEITLGDSDEEEGFKLDEFEEVVVPEDENPDGTKKCMCTCHQNPNAKNFHMRNIHCTNCCLKVAFTSVYPYSGPTCTCIDSKLKLETLFTCTSAN